MKIKKRNKAQFHSSVVLSKNLPRMAQALRTRSLQLASGGKCDRQVVTETPTVPAVTSVSQIHLFDLGLSPEGTHPLVGAMKPAQVSDRW